MTSRQFVIVYIEIGLVFAVLLGLFVRSRVALTRAFTAYLASVLWSLILPVAYSASLQARAHFLVAEGIQGLMRVAVALELTVHTFRAFPVARTQSLRLVWLVLVITAGAVALPVATLDYHTVVDHALPRLLYGTAALFAGLGAIVLWYRLPVAPIHKAILMGFVPFLLIFSVALHSLREFEWVHVDVANYAHMLAYTALLGYWAYAAWRRDPVGSVADIGERLRVGPKPATGPTKPRST